MRFSKANAGSQSGRRRRIMRALKIEEISAVDRPAQEGATALIMKRDDGEDGSQKKTVGPEAVEKRAMLTTSTDGHVHLILIDHGHGEMTSGETSYVDGHSHPWVRTEGGTIVIGEARGHTHEPAQMGKAGPSGEIEVDDKGDDTMATKNDKDQATGGEAAKDNSELDALKAQIETLTAVNALTGDVRKHYDGLASDEDRKAFLAKSADDRKAEVDEAIAKAADADPVIYKASDGSEYRKSDDPRLIAMAKQADEDRKARKAAEDRAADADLRKRAADLEHIPGDEDTRVEMLKAIDAIPDETARDNALKALKAQNDAMASAFQERGHRSGTSTVVEKGGEAGDAERELNELAEKRAKDDNVTFEQAYAQVIKSREGRQLYAKCVQQ